MDRSRGLSVRLKFTLSYAAFLTVAGAGLIAVVWVFLLRYVPDRAITIPADRIPGARLPDDAPRSPPTYFIPGRSDLWEAFAPRAATMLALLLLFGLVGGWILAGRMLAPLNRITDATRKTGSGSLSHRIALPGRSDEFRELADALDGMLARLEAHVGEQQRFAANASHELRTPLAITRTLLDVARKDRGRATGELVEILYDVNTRAIELTDAMLLLSRVEQRSFSREPVDLSLVAEAATETLLLVAEEHGVTIETTGDITLTVGSPALLLQMVTNLVHNAIVHNLPERGTVHVDTAMRSGSARLTVENTGDRLSPELFSTLTEPFQRGTERIRSGHAGVGLGLAIVESIVRAHDGTLALTARAAGGLHVEVQLPASSMAAEVTGKSK